MTWASNTKVKGDAGEHYALSQFSFVGKPAAKMPDNWKAYDLIVDEGKGLERPARVSVKVRTETEKWKKGPWFEFDGNDNTWDWLVLIFKPNEGSLESWIIPFDVAIQHAAKTSKNAGSHKVYLMYAQLQKPPFKNYQNNWSLERNQNNSEDMQPSHLTKSLFQSGRQCPKRLWLEIHRSDLMQWDESARARAAEGNRLGQVARKLLLDDAGELLVSAPDFETALRQTSALLAELPTHNPILFEAAFEYEGVRIRVDALIRFMLADRLVEVKAGTQPTDEYLWDCALQTWVMRGAGRPVQTVSLYLVDSDFVYKHEGDYRGLLALDNYTEEVEALLPRVPTLVTEFKAVMSGPQPEMLTGRHCKIPHECPFLRHCRQTEACAPAYPVEDLPHATKDLLDRLKASGFFDLRDVPDDALTNPLQLRVAEAARSGAVFVSPDFAATLDGIAYPRHYLDFETIAFTVPRWIGTRPYQQICFQFSCHIEHADGLLEHREFLDVTGKNPSSSFVAELLAAIGPAGPIIVWNETFEISRLRELAAMFPEHAEVLTGFAERIVDLMKIYKKHYYHRDMHGSWSIKKVLPTIAPELDYEALEIGDGSMAQGAYRRAIAPETSEVDCVAIRRNLLDYCQRDTEAMVRLARWRGERNR